MYNVNIFKKKVKKQADHKGLLHSLKTAPFSHQWRLDSPLSSLHIGHRTTGIGNAQDAGVPGETAKEETDLNG